ncbi:12715_t:CDS:1 [Dentiscutata heterogama]|uniref:12715_t:CDS:1 n=1 Tax=Dentiscutata heterogama TaxID=1316150 RepID=A0ACA9N073_9GLOM|nr:12715_t:CDS:1 [Dentiscutata heterogama]
MENKKSTMVKTCDVCVEETETLYDLECEHKYCQTCLYKLFTDTTYVLPIRCCNKEINVDFVLKIFTPEDSQQIIQRTGRASHKLFCPTPGCERPIHVTAESKTSACPDCKKEICVKCRSHAHPNKKCWNGKNEKRFRKITEKRGWRQCTVCGVFIERRGGCKNIHCPCGNTFCYHCGKQICKCIIGRSWARKIKQTFWKVVGV